MHHVGVRRKVERRGDFPRNSDGLRGRRGTVLAGQDVQRVGRDKILGEKGRDVADAGLERRGNTGMRQVGVDQRLQFGNELMNELRRKVKLEELDRNQPIVFGVIRAKNRSECPCANLVKNAKWAECFRVSGARGFRVQWVLLGVLRPQRTSGPRCGRKLRDDRNTSLLDSRDKM